MVTSPPDTARALSAPSAPSSGTPVESVTRGALTKPHPSQVMPLGFATTRSAAAPKTSSRPPSIERLVPVTSLRITLADPVDARLGLPARSPPSFDVAKGAVELFRIAPAASVLKSR